MTTPTSAQQTPVYNKLDERILVVPRTDLFAHTPAWHGLHAVDFDAYLTIIQQHQQFHPRSIMETDPAFKQIIPYLVFMHDNRYFLMQRRSTASETRLQNKHTLGIGGHIRQEDITSASIFDWAHREFHEEVHYAGNLEITPLGILNDDSNAVGQVHIGFVLLLKGDSANISIKSELKSGELVELHECAMLGDQLESWSQFVVEHLIR